MIELKNEKLHGGEFMKIIYATTNIGKKNQVEEFLKYNNYDIEIVTLKDIGFNEEIEENRRNI